VDRDAPLYRPYLEPEYRYEAAPRRESFGILMFDTRIA